MRSRIIITFAPPDAERAVWVASQAIHAAGISVANIKFEKEDAWVATWEPPFERMIAGDLFARYIVNDQAKALLEAMTEVQVLVRFGGVKGKYHSIEATVNFKFEPAWNPGDLNDIGYKHEGGVDPIGKLLEQHLEDMMAQGYQEPCRPSAGALTAWVRGV